MFAKLKSIITKIISLFKGNKEEIVETVEDIVEEVGDIKEVVEDVIDLFTNDDDIDTVCESCIISADEDDMEVTVYSMDLTVAEMKEIAKEKGLTGYSKMTKPQLFDLISK